MSKDSDLDFNFDEISSGEPTVVKSDKQEKPVEKQELKPLGWTLTIPTENETGWVSRDVTECTEKEFHRWLCAVFPFHDKDADTTAFRSIQIRLKTIKEITSFYSSQMFVSKSQDLISSH